MSSKEFTDWQGYFAIEPYGYPIDEWRWGMLAANLCNAIRSTIPTKKKLKPFKPSDFYPNQKPTDDLTPAQRQYIERKRKKKRG
jgi:hypothetical protein